MKNIKKIFGFTLIEILVGILIFSLIMIGGFQAFGSVNIGKVKLMQKIETEKQYLYFVEKFFEEIKKGGTIDYEEYFNRKIVGYDVEFGYYKNKTGFGNFGPNGNVGTTNYGNGFYYCRSGDGNQMSLESGNPSLGCFDNFNLNYPLPGFNYSGEPQRYGEYSFQFIDYNSNYDDDLGDEDGDGNILGDDDDEFLGDGPIAFLQGKKLEEFYLISGDKKTRTLFRWKVEKDPNGPIGGTCLVDSNNIINGNSCLGTIEFLKLVGKDWGLNHDFGTLDSDGTQGDGVIDTWLIHPDFSTNSSVVAGSNLENYRLPLFSKDINISKFKIFLYPNIDSNLAFKNKKESSNVAPYVRIYLSILPSWNLKKRVRGEQKEVNFSTTISLTDIFSK